MGRGVGGRNELREEGKQGRKYRIDQKKRSKKRLGCKKVTVEPFGGGGGRGAGGGEGKGRGRRDNQESIVFHINYPVTVCT